METMTKEELKKDLYDLHHKCVMSQIECAKSVADMPDGLTQSKIQVVLSKLSKYKNYDKIPAAEFAEISDSLIYDAAIDSKFIRSFLKGICSRHFLEKDVNDAVETLIENFKNSQELNLTIEEVSTALFKMQNLIHNDADKSSHLYIVPNRPKISGGNFYTVYISKNKKLELDDIVRTQYYHIFTDKTPICSEDVDSLEKVIRDKYDPSFRRVGGLILKKNETIGSVNFFEPRKDEEDEVENQIAALENNIAKMTLVRDGLSSEILKMQSSIEKIKQYKKEK